MAYSIISMTMKGKIDISPAIYIALIIIVFTIAIAY
tara:strand:- start:39 stop:146 length:108 start_codon:yes stop_codon:yes gene_type:complete